MSVDIKQSTFAFDYDDLPTDTRLVVEQCRDGIRSCARAAVIEIGRMLQVVHDELSKHGSGSFVAWLSLEFDFSHTTAYNYMSVARQVPGFSTGLKIDAKALYALSATSTPQEVRDEFLEKAAAGEQVKEDDVRKRLGKSKRTRKTKSTQPTTEPTTVEYTEPTPASRPATPIASDYTADIDYESLPEVSKEFMHGLSRIDVEGSLKLAVIAMVARSIETHHEMRRMDKDDLREFTSKGGDLDKFLRELIHYNLEVVAWCRQALPDDEQKIRRLS